jgi:hypothetical protein
MISIESHKGLPIEYESFLLERYDSFMTNCRYIKIYHQEVDFFYLLVYKHEKMVDLLIFGNQQDTSSCLNSLVGLDREIIDACIKKVFNENPVIKKIKIDASYNNFNLKRSFLYSKFEDYVLDLPTTMDDYYLQLGRSTRRNSKKHQAKLLEDYPQTQFIVKCGENIHEDLINQILQLNIARMKSKGKTPGRYYSNILKLCQYARHYGCLAYIEVDGRIIAGSLSIITNKHMFGLINSHDNEFSKYNAGEMCALYRIQIGIEKGITTFHFLWGESDLKKRLLGKPHALYSYFIYRDYSIEYLINNIKSKFWFAINLARHSKYSKPIRDAIKFYRKSKLTV